MKYTKDDIVKFYNDEGLNSNTTQDMVYSKDISKERLNLVKSFLDAHARNLKNFLEVGCAEGLYCVYIGDKCSNVIGLDISEPKIHRAKKHKNVSYIVGDWDNLPFEDKSIDFVLASECLEHSLNPTTTLKELFRVSDFVLISIPLESRVKENPLEQGSGHLHAFDMNGFIDLVKDYTISDYAIHESGKFLVCLAVDLSHIQALGLNEFRC